ncbi:MAG: bile acid:sodium symporter family protein [Hellea sp.]|nr:bile acid:sodium symporter family protein [Hellea sp.]
MENSALDDFTLDVGQNSEFGLSVAIFIMMLAVALSLKPENFKDIAKFPKPYFAGAVAQLLGLPLLTYLVCFVLNPHPTLALGMIIVACCPGGTVSNLICMMGRGNVALSVSLTATSSLFAALLTPVTILFWTSMYGPTAELLETVDFDVLDFLRKTFVLLAIPIFIGMAVRHYSPKNAERALKPLSIIGFLLLLLVIVAGLQKYLIKFLELGIWVIGLALLHNALAFLLGYLTGVAVGADRASKRSLTIEIGIQNSGLALVILLTALAGFGGAAAIMGIWGVWHVVAGLILVGIFRLQDKRIAHV